MRYSHHGSARSTSSFGDADNVFWNELVSGYIARLRETPDAATSNTFSVNVAVLLWAVAKFEAAAAAAGHLVGVGGASASASASAEVGIQPYVCGFDDDVELLKYFTSLQHVRNFLCLNGTPKATTQILQNLVAEQILVGSDAVVEDYGYGDATTFDLFSVASASNACQGYIHRMPPNAREVLEVRNFPIVLGFGFWGFGLWFA